MVRSFVRAGFERILFLNGHGGNVTPGTQAITEMANSDDLADEVLVALASYWTIAGDTIRADKHGMDTPQLSHACEYETSMMLHLHKELVVMSAAQGSVPVLDSPFYHVERGGRVNVAMRFHRKSDTGAMGRPEAATAEKGASLLASMIDEVAAFIEDFSHWKHCPVLKPGE